MVKQAQGWGDEEQELSPWVGKVLLVACVVLLVAGVVSGVFKSDDTPVPTPSVSPSAAATATAPGMRTAVQK